MTTKTKTNTSNSKATTTTANALATLAPAPAPAVSGESLLTKKQLAALAHVKTVIEAGDEALLLLSQSKAVQGVAVQVGRYEECRKAINECIKSGGTNLSGIYRYLHRVLTAGTIPVPTSAKSVDLYLWAADVSGPWIHGTAAKPRTEKTQEVRRAALENMAGPIVVFLNQLRQVNDKLAMAQVTAPAPAPTPAPAPAPTPAPAPAPTPAPAPAPAPVK